jgi:hydroxymethylbilane synthase
MTKPKTFIIGTRGSLLALTQCGQVKKSLEELTGQKFELKIIKTQGDQIQDKALWQVDGKDFFTKELDEALLKKEVDLVVHSYKDLGTERPSDFSLAAVTKRQVAHDILLIKNSTISSFKSRNHFKVGTSSPRRIANLNQDLKSCLPFASQELVLETAILRGNVNSRIEKLRRDEYDAIVLAYAGLERLAMDESAGKTLKELLRGLNFMILPQRLFPSASSQGALAIECLKNRNDNLKDLIASIHCSNTAQNLQREREIFRSYGGGCHLPLGIYVTPKMEIIKGTWKNEVINQIKFQGEEQKIAPPHFIGMPLFKKARENFVYDELIVKKEHEVTLNSDRHYLLASSYGASNIKSQPKSLWVSGIRSWKNLAQRGLWVNGSHEGLGEENLKIFLESYLVNCIYNEKPRLTVLTHEHGQSELGDILGVYSRSVNSVTDQYRVRIEACQSFFWTSYFEYEVFCQHFPSIVKKAHYCGGGKTFEEFKRRNVTISSLVSFEHFQRKATP